MLERGDPTGLAHMVQGAVLMARGRADEAVEVIEQAQITRPTCDVTYALEGSVRRYLGHWQKAVDLMDHAIRLSAVPPAWYPTVLACSLFIGGRLDQAGATAEAVLEESSDNLEAMLVLAAVQAEMGLDRRARATAEQIRDRFPAMDIDHWLTHPPVQGRGVHRPVAGRPRRIGPARRSGRLTDQLEREVVHAARVDLGQVRRQPAGR